ncbi:MAG: hypothetical protein ACI84C_000563 [Flavobacteriales bacterium]|jgi:hypothetical protein
MINTTSAELYKSILYRAADIYEVEIDDVERDIGQNFDPIVRFMSGAMASELEKIYQDLNGTESRLQERLAQVLLPEYFHLPQPSHALASAQAASQAFVIDETTLFRTNDENSDDPPVHFTPIFPSLILPAEVKVIATENIIIHVNNRKGIRRNKVQSTSEVQRFAIGFESPQPIENWQGASLYFNLIGKSESDSEKTFFYSTMAKAQYAMGRKALRHISGLGKNDLALEDYLNGNERLESIVRARYDELFVTFTDSHIEATEPHLASDFMRKWQTKEEVVSDEESDKEKSDERDEISELDEMYSKPLYWLEVHLQQPIEIHQIESRLRMDFNVFPVVNRKLNGQENGDHHYLRNNAIKWIPLSPEDDFLSMRKVYEEGAPENKEYVFKPFSEFKEERRPSYTLRHGGIGRWDEYNAWKRLSYIVDVLQDNFKHTELIEEAAGSLSIEEVHLLLRKKINKSASEEKPTKNIYVLLHSGDTSGVRARVEYWSSIGEEGNGVNARTQLDCISKLKTNFLKKSTELVTSSIDGRAPLNAIEKMDAMRSTLLSRGRLVTREDVKDYCISFLGSRISEVQIKDGVGTDPRFDFGMTRMLNVVLTPSKSALREDWDGVCRQLQVLITKQSTSSVPISVATNIQGV